MGANTGWGHGFPTIGTPQRQNGVLTGRLAQGASELMFWDLETLPGEMRETSVETGSPGALGTALRAAPSRGSTDPGGPLFSAGVPFLHGTMKAGACSAESGWWCGTPHPTLVPTPNCELQPLPLRPDRQREWAQVSP